MVGSNHMGYVAPSFALRVAESFGSCPDPPAHGGCKFTIRPDCAAPYRFGASQFKLRNKSLMRDCARSCGVGQCGQIKLANVRVSPRQRPPIGVIAEGAAPSGDFGY